MSDELPLLKDLLLLSNQMDHGRLLSHSDFIQLKRVVATRLIRISRKPESDLQVFAALEALRLISAIESRVEFPKAKEDVQSEEQQKKKNEVPQESHWDQSLDKYKPDNKDITGEGGGKKKSIDLVRTDAEIYKGLLRQKIYDEFNLKDWSSVPVDREPIARESRPSKKLIVEPLGATSIDVPVPYGYSLVPGAYGDHRIREVGPGEFQLQVASNQPLTLGLVRIQAESHFATPPRSVSPKELVDWPPSLLLFVQSLKGLAPIEAAARLEKYISEDGGFLYYSKGEQISESELIRIDQKFKDLLTQMPKPMAMAHVGAFNCDGAAWIGALLLRDVLNIPVRIASGRTSSKSVKLMDEEFHVVKSTDPSHSWVEVFDGQRWVPFDMTPRRNNPELGREELDSKNQEPQDQEPSHASDEDVTGFKGIADLIPAKSTAQERGGANLTLVDHVLHENELILLEHLLHDGFKTPFQNEAANVLKALGTNPNWRNQVEISQGKISTLLQDSKLAKFQGLQSLVTEIRVDLSQGNVREAKQKVVMVQRLLRTLGEYRNHTRQESEALRSIDSIFRELDQIKHPNAKEFEVVSELLESLPGSISKAWLAKTYGSDFGRLGNSGNIHLAQDIVSGKLKGLLQMAAVSEFVDMTLNSTPESQWKDEATLNRSLVPKPRQELILTRNPLDFARMLWSLRPGEPMFAPVLQGRQFAIGSLETRRVANPKHPIERKVTVVYYDVSHSMKGALAEIQDSLLMAFVDKALSETDAIGRPVHEIYLVPFAADLLEGIHISSREDAMKFFSHRIQSRTETTNGTNIQKTIENFYEIIGSSYQSKLSQGREKLFRRANMVLISDGGSVIDMKYLERKRMNLPKDIQLHMNIVSLGDGENLALKTLSQSANLSTNKPTYRKLDLRMIEALENVSVDFDPAAFATNERISGHMISEINDRLQKVAIDPRQPGDASEIDRALSQIQVASMDVRQLRGIREALSLTQLETAMEATRIDPRAKLRLVEAVIESYQDLTGRSWREMTLPEKHALESLRAWARR